MPSCYHPLGAIHSIWFENINGKFEKRTKVSILKGGYDPEHPPKNLRNDEFHQDRYIPLPCGRCTGCRLQYSREWADRCMMESSYHESNYFITLTYNNDNLPKCLPGSDIHSLVKKDLQDFFKKLRTSLWYEYTVNHTKASLYYDPKPKSKWRSKFKAEDPEGYKEYIENIPKIRYYACGEYSPLRFARDGSKCGFRPHYHAIVFGLKLDDLKLFKKDIENNYLYFTSERISKLWPFGFHLITNVTWETCAYTARYIMKKQLGNYEVYDEKAYTPEFTIMSRKPGLAHKFFEDNPEIIEQEKYLSTDRGAHKLRSNRYFDKQFDIYYPESYNEIKEKRIESAELTQFLRSEQSSLSYKEQMKVDEINKLAQIKSLKRKETFDE